MRRLKRVSATSTFSAPPAEFEARYYEQAAATTIMPHAGALGGTLGEPSQSLAQAADRLHGFL